ncbi:hypothetical protein Cha6605_1537 [Chamaesiphon minutus PCC 6605]|uniref:Uncharacterized protein n=2 Tax=Chamaesiphon TaxID=217161 RepID=K9UE43_CHAP6|nr:hypothetical protein Cha6605_1537 [Chamaesiphon minutus PCC 6605]
MHKIHDLLDRSVQVFNLSFDRLRLASDWLATRFKIINTQPLNLNQALICIGAGIPVVIPALLFDRFAPMR